MYYLYTHENELDITMGVIFHFISLFDLLFRHLSSLIRFCICSSVITW